MSISTTERELSLKVNNNFLKFIGKEMYHSLSSIVSELISNAWDADAENVHILLNTNKKGASGFEGEIIVKDDGHGMNFQELEEKYLNIGYNKREGSGKVTSKFKRLKMGRKGIGKFAPFGLGNKIQILTKQDGQDNTGVELDYDFLISNHDKKPPEIKDGSISEKHYTQVIISDFHKNISLKRHSHFIHAMIIKNFIHIIENDLMNIKLSINNAEIPISFSPIDIKKKADVIVNFGDSETIDDNRYFENEKYRLPRYEFSLETPKIKEAFQAMKTAIQNEYSTLSDDDLKITGKLLVTRELKDLSSVDDQSNITTSFNIVSIYSRNKMGAADILPDIKTKTTYDRYVYGNINADFLEEDGLEDIAVSNRSGYVEDDVRYIELLKFLKIVVKIATTSKKQINADIKDIKTEESMTEKEVFDGLMDVFENNDVQEKAVKKLGTSYFQFQRRVYKKETELEDEAGEKNTKIFISHDSRNAVYGQKIVELLKKSGLEESEIYFSSSDSPESRAAFTEDWLKEIEKTIRKGRFTLFLVSKEFYDSNMSLAEVGAVWTKDMKHGMVLMDDFKREWIEEPLSKRKIFFTYDSLVKNTSNNRIQFIEEIWKCINKTDVLTEEHKEQINKLNMDAGKQDEYFPLRRFQILPKCKNCSRSIEPSKLIGNSLACICASPGFEDEFIISNVRYEKE